MTFEESLLQVAPESVLNALPEYLLDVPRQVHAATGITVQVLDYSAEVRAYSPAMSMALAVTDINPEASAITIWCQPLTLSASVLGHELMHLRRDVLESVPKLAPVGDVDPEARDHVLQLENELEHLFIIPEEIAAFPEAEQRWSDYYSGLIDRHIKAGQLIPLFLHWCQIRNSLPNQLALAQKLESHLRSLGQNWFQAADHLREDMKQALPDKVATQAAILARQPSNARRVIGTVRYVTHHGRLETEWLSVPQRPSALVGDRHG